MMPDSLRQRAQPFRPDHKSPERQAGDRHRHRDREDGREAEIERSENAVPLEKAEAEAFREMIDRDQREHAESPEHQRVREARQRPLGNHFALQHHFPDEIRDAAAQRLKAEIRIFLSTGGSTRHTLPNRRQNPYTDAASKIRNRPDSGQDS